MDYKTQHEAHNNKFEEGLKNQKKEIDGDKEFRPRIYIDGHPKALSWSITPNFTIGEFVQKYNDMETGRPEGANRITIKYKGKPLNAAQTFGYYGICAPKHLLLVSFHVDGGAQQPINDDNDNWEEKRLPLRSFNSKHPMLKDLLTDEIDSITGDDHPDFPRIKMPCGHNFACMTMLSYIHTQFEEDPQLLEFLCPTCCENWDWCLVAAVAALSEKEFERYSMILFQHNKELLEDETQCPHCQSIIERPNDLSMSRVRCSACSNGDFCYQCLQPWKTNGFQICGYDDCLTTTISESIQIENCGSFVPMGLENKKDPDGNEYKVPKTRACPKCLTLIDWASACKHMICRRKDCGTQFCFVCLQICSDGKWKCGEYYDICPVAPVQKLN